MKGRYVNKINKNNRDRITKSNISVSKSNKLQDMGIQTLTKRGRTARKRNMGTGRDTWQNNDTWAVFV